MNTKALPSALLENSRHELVPLELTQSMFNWARLVIESVRVSGRAETGKTGGSFRGELEKGWGPQLSSLAFGPYGAFQSLSSDCISPHFWGNLPRCTDYQTRGERTKKEQDRARERGKKNHLPSFPALQSYLHWCVWPFEFQPPTPHQTPTTLTPSLVTPTPLFLLLGLNELSWATCWYRASPLQKRMI